MHTKSLMGLLLLSGLLSACTPINNTPASPSPTPTLGSPAVTATPVPSPTRIVTNTRTIENKDGSSTLVTTYSDGTTSEERTFKAGRLSRVTRNTNAAGQRTVKVTYREDAREVELQDQSWADKAMDATGDALATAASKTKQGAVEVADKAEDVGDATKKGVKKGVREVGDKAEDVGDATKKGVKKGVREIGDKAEDVGDAVKKGAKKVGKKVKDVVH
jgi:hypothetical protein